LNGLPPSDADDDPAGGSQPLIALSIALKSGGGAMDTSAVGFNDQTSVTPDEVRHKRDSLNEQVAIYLRPLEVASLEQAQKLLLELKARFSFLGIVVFDAKPEASDAALALAPLHELQDFGQIEDSLDFGLIDRIPKRRARLAGSNVKQSPSETGAGDPVDHGPIGGNQSPIPVRGDPGWTTPAAIRGDDVHPTSGVTEDSVQPGSGSV